jgi:heterodisulfide reductase subunit A
MPDNPTATDKYPDEQPRIGVYVCNCGGNIGDVVHCQLAAETLANLPDVVASRSHMFMCSDPGQNLIIEDIREKGVNRVVIGACSPFLHEQTFRKTLERAGLNPYLYYHVGLREQDSWVHHDCKDEATKKAISLMATGIAKARHLEALEPIYLEAHKHALVIGGGLAGLRAALDIARRGLKVTLIEKTPFIGGRVPRLNHVFPAGEDARQLIGKLVAQVIAHPGISVYTQTEVVGVKGYVGDFHIELRQHARGFSKPLTQLEYKMLDVALPDSAADIPDEFNYALTKRRPILMPYAGGYPDVPAIDWEHLEESETLRVAAGALGLSLADEISSINVNVGAIVVATGFRPYQPFQGEFGYGEFPQVVTLPQLERMLAADGPTGGKLEWAGRPVRSVAMIHCVGSRQIDGVHEPQEDGQVNDYCSRVCCTATLQAANEIREKFPQVQVYDFYQDIRTYGRGHEDYYRRASENRVLFLRYFGEQPPVIQRAPQGEAYPLLVKVNDQLTGGEEIEVPVDLVVLAVGMMPNPVEDLMELLKITPGKDRFLLEAHPKLRPVETAVPGVVLAGTAQGPMNIQESSASGSAAAAKVSALLGQAEVELEPFVARVNQELCQGSGECVKVCPYEGAITLTTVSMNGRSLRQAMVTPANCKGCGTCVGACPNQAIDLLGWTLEQYEAMLDALVMEIPSLEVVE